MGLYLKGSPNPLCHWVASIYLKPDAQEIVTSHPKGLGYNGGFRQLDNFNPKRMHTVI